MTENIITYHKPVLRRPVLVLGFGGWSNAGEVSIGVTDYLKKRLGAIKFAGINSNHFYDLTVLRPSTVIKNGVVKELHLPVNEFFFFKNDKSPHDLVIFQGVEPNLKWKEFTEIILNFSRQLGVKEIYTVGGTFDRVLHTQEPKVSAVMSMPEMKNTLLEHGFELPDYQGLTSLHTFLLFTCSEKKIPAIGMWGHTPLYLQKSPKVYYTVLKKLIKLLGVDLDLGELNEASNELEKQIDKVIANNPEFRNFIKKLERDCGEEGKNDHIPMQSENVIRMEDFLKKEEDTI